MRKQAVSSRCARRARAGVRRAERQASAWCAGSMITATRREPVATSAAPCSTTHIPERDRTRASSRSRSAPRGSRRRAERDRRPLHDEGSLPPSQSPSQSSDSQRSTPGVSDSTSQSSHRTTRPGDCGPSGSVASPMTRARRAPWAKSGASASTAYLRAATASRGSSDRARRRGIRGSRSSRRRSCSSRRSRSGAAGNRRSRRASSSRRAPR